MNIKSIYRIMIVSLISFILLPGSLHADYPWPFPDGTSNVVITGTPAEVRPPSGGRDHIHGAVDLHRDHGAEVQAVRKGALQYSGDDNGSDEENANIANFRYMHVDVFVHGPSHPTSNLNDGDNISQGQVFAEVLDYRQDGDDANDHLDFKEAEDNFPDATSNPQLDRRDPLRSFRGEAGGLNSTFDDQADPEINEITFFENDPNPTVNNNPEPFPRMNGDTWVVWGPVDVGAKIRDDGIFPGGTASNIDLGIHEASFTISDNHPLLGGDQDLTSDFSQEYDTVPGTHHGFDRQDITKATFLPPRQNDQLGHHYNILTQPG